MLPCYWVRRALRCPERGRKGSKVSMREAKDTVRKTKFWDRNAYIYLFQLGKSLHSHPAHIKAGTRVLPHWKKVFTDVPNLNDVEMKFTR